MIDVKAERIPTADGTAVAKEQTKFDVVLSDSGQQTIKVIKVVRALTSLGADDAMELVESAPNAVKRAVDKAEAEDVKKQLQEVGATVEITAQGATLLPRVLPVPQPSAIPSPPAGPATGPAAFPPPPVTAPHRSAEVVRASTHARLAEGIVPSGLMKAGYGLIELGSIGLFLLVAAQWWEATRAGFGGTFSDGVFAATRGAEARGMGWSFIVLAIVTLILASGLTLLPRVGLGYRAGGYALGGIALLGALIALSQGGGLYLLIPFLVAGTVGVFLMQKGTSSFRKDMKTRLGGQSLYRKRWLVSRFSVIAGLWTLGIIGHVLIMTVGGGWTARPGGYIGVVLLLLGLLGAAAMFVGSRGRPTMWMGPEGHIYDQVPTE